MVDATYAHIELIIDESGSMQAHRDDTEGGVNAFVREQQSLPGRATISMTTFSNQTRLAYEHVPVADATPFVLRPRGNTALLDAIGETIVRTGQWLESLPESERPGLVTVEIVTDGRENASREYTAAAIKTMIETQQSVYSWVFSYMGANQDAIIVGEGLGVPHERSLTYSTGRTQTAFLSKSGQTRAQRSAAASGRPLFGNGYSEAERNQAVEVGEQSAS